MSVDKCKRGVFKVESYGNGSLVACHTRESCLNLDLSQALKLILMLLFSKHDYKAANHNFLDYRNILNAL